VEKSLLVALFVHPVRAPKINQPLPSMLSWGLQHSRCQTLPRTSNVPGPSPVLSLSPPMLCGVSATGVATQPEKDDGQVVERILLEGSDRFAEQTGADDQDEVGHYDEENRKCCAVPGGQYCFVLGPASTYPHDWRMRR
jgi:hypothetical protein